MTVVATGRTLRREPITVPTKSRLEEAVTRLGMDLGLLYAAAPAVESVLHAVAAGAGGVRGGLAVELDVL